MKAIGISEEAVMKYTDKRETRVKNTEDVPDQQNFYTEPLAPDSLITLAPLDARIDSLRKIKN